jgi:hypothetical protein
VGNRVNHFYLLTRLRDADRLAGSRHPAIDDRDQASKATLAFMLQMSRLDFPRQRTGGTGPALTLPVGR